MQLCWGQVTSSAEAPKVLQPIQPARGCFNCSYLGRKLRVLVAQACSSCVRAGMGTKVLREPERAVGMTEPGRPESFPQPLIYPTWQQGSALARWCSPDQAVSVLRNATEVTER